MKAYYNKILSEWEVNFMGYIAMAIVLSTAVGSIAIMSIMMQGNGAFQMLQMFLIVSVCSLLNASIISAQKPKTILNLLFLSLITSSIVLIFGYALGA